MSNQWIEKLSNVKNPNSGKTLLDEGRLLGCLEEGEFLKIKYNREGITPIQKREIENQILDSIGTTWDQDNILILTVSESSQEVFDHTQTQPAPQATTPDEQPAGIKVGHGSVGTPKKIDGVSKIIAIASGKGGVGKSTFTANLACTLANEGYKVGVIDADIYGPSIPMIMGVRSEKPMASPDKKIMPVEKHGVKLMSFGFFIEEKDPVIWRGPMLGGVLNQFLFDVVWGELDYLILDLPPGTGDIQLSMIQNASVDGSIIISTPQDVALLDAMKAFEMFKKLELPILGLVENMAYFVCDGCGKNHHIFGEEGVSKGAKEHGEKFLGSVPLELALRKAADVGHPYMAQPANKDSEVWKGFTQVAKELTSGDNQPKKKGFLKSLFS